MARAFADIAFTEAVLAEQSARGSADHYAKWLGDDADRSDHIGPAEAEFILQRDGFYQATVGAEGWPYVQFRGGPRGFLRPINEKQLAYADFRGNRQYVSAGNLKGDDRVSLILMDYPNQRRLKIFGHAKLSEEPELVASLMPSGYRAKPERAVVINIASVDWNCPAHIPQRLTVEEYRPIIAELQGRIAALEAENERLKQA
ncbi:MAG: pyridoxamine 5'-phosphate oxidase family protein [Pseudomonadota bacterium]